MAHLDGLVDVASGDGNSADDGSAGDHPLEAGGIGAAGSEDFWLPLDLMAIGGGFHEVDHAVVADDGGIHELDSCAFAEGGATFLRSRAGDVVGDGGIESEAEVWLDLEGGRLGTAEADFLLDGEDRVEIVGWRAFRVFQLTEGCQEDKHGCAVVERLGVDAIAEFHELGQAGDEIADADDFIDLGFGHPGIDEIVGELGVFSFFLRRHDVDRFGAEHADDFFAAVDDDALRGESFRVESANRVEADETFVVDVGDDEADLVHVGGGHGFFGVGLAFHEGNHVAHVVDADVGDEVFQLGEDKLADGSFKSRGTGRFANTGKQRNIDRHDGRKSGDHQPVWRAANIVTWRVASARYLAAMNGHLIIDLANLPEDGKDYTGELPKEIFDLPGDDAQAVGPLEYDLRVNRFGSELLLAGALSAPFEFTCVRTLHPFVQTIHLEDAAISLEITAEGPIDATDALREEILIHFPIDPRCEDGDVPQKCEIDSRYLSVDKPADDALPTPPHAGSDDRWSALDNLKDL